MIPGQAPEIPIGNVEAEMCVISGLMCEAKLIDDVADWLKPDDFTEYFIGSVYSLIVREHSAGRPANPVTLKQFLQNDPAYDQLGGFAWLCGLTESRLAAAEARGAARHVLDLAQRRRLVDGLKQAVEAANDYDQPVEALIAVADQAITEARDGEEARGEYSGVDCLDMVANNFDEPVVGVTCRIVPAIDSLIGHMRPSHLIIGAGRPGMGKTATAVSYALGAANNGYGVLFISEEMSAQELGERMAADMCFDERVPYSAIRDRTLSGSQRMAICRARDHMRDLPLQIIDKVVTVGQLRTIVKRWKRRFEARGDTLDLVIVDYMQRMRVDGKMNRFEAVTEISASLKDIAKDNGLAVFALSQLSRKVEERADKRPQMSDLRESGQIEQDADTILFFLRDEYYLRMEGEPEPGNPRYEAWHTEMEACRGKIEFICAKRRAGETGSAIGEFHGAFQAVRG